MQKKNNTSIPNRKYLVPRRLGKPILLCKKRHPPLTYFPLSSVPAGTPRPPPLQQKPHLRNKTTTANKKQVLPYQGVTYVAPTCQGCSQSRQSGMAPSHAPTAQPAAGTIAPSSCTAGLTRKKTFGKVQPGLDQTKGETCFTKGKHFGQIVFFCFFPTDKALKRNRWNAVHFCFVFP